MSPTRRYPYWVVDGRVYDLTPFIPHHPGGTRWFARSNGRDISAAVHHYHQRPAAVLAALTKYEVHGVYAHDAIDPGLNVPQFILPAAFDATIDTPEIVGNPHAEDKLLTDVNRVLRTPHMSRQLRIADLAFDAIAVVLLGLHLGLAFPLLARSEGGAQATLLCAGLVFTRTALAAVGHYHCHRAKNGLTDWGDALFDIQYVGASLVLFDGHVLLHHLYTQSHADVKRTVFTAMLQLPRLWRVPVVTLMRFGNLVSGMWVRYVTFTFFEPEPAGSGWPLIKHASFLALRLLLILELVHALASGRLLLWAIQFFVVIWLNQLMIVASHDFELPTEDHDAHCAEQRPLRKDWGDHQVRTSFDMSVVGLRWVDIFLTAGLSSHRAHHLLPFQRSGFANILSEAPIRAACEKHGIPWEPTRSFPLERLPALVRHYLLSPLCGLEGAGLLRETFDPGAFRLACSLIFFAFLGEGGI